MLLLDTGQMLNLNNQALPILISCLAIFVTVYFANKEQTRKMRKETDEKFDERFDLKVDKTVYEIKHKQVNAKIDSLYAKSMSDIAQHEVINEKIDTIGSSVKWIEGYMKAQQELNKK